MLGSERAARRRPLAAAAASLPLLLLLPLLAVSTSLAVSCGRCELARCPPVPDCPQGFTTDACDCCPECARTVNETCGWRRRRLQQQQGKCAEGLRCVALSSSSPRRLGGRENGVCLPKETLTDPCKGVTCDTGVKHQCPSDSILIRNNTTSLSGDGCCKETFTCQCNFEACKQSTCGIGFGSVMNRKGEGKPGACCDEYMCKSNAECEGKICHQPEVDCPVHSYKLPHQLPYDGCCILQQKCQCHSADKCPPAICAEGLQVQVVAKRTGEPGFCCDKFECVNVTAQSCLYDGVEYRHNEKWKQDNCTTCVCKKGLTFCKMQTCTTSMCSWMRVPENECCPVCEGCLSESGRLYNNSASWRETDCITCDCEEGQVLCQAEMCAVSCPNPRHVPGQCCPVCDESCTLECNYGFALDEDEREICECAKPVHCPPLSSCKKKCANGFRRTRSGCLKCRCNKCPQLNCSKHCVYGYVKNDQGCTICKCKEIPRLSSTPKPRIRPEKPKQKNPSCLSMDGHRYENGESWHDGCRICYCHGGHEMCSLITCPVPKCSNPIFRVGDCCPTCPGTVIFPPGTGNKELCRAKNGNHYVEGETWDLDDCTHCICHDGTILCETEQCPPLLCHYPVKSHNQCCAVCPRGSGKNIPLVSKQSVKHCFSEGTMKFRHGEVWKASPCQSCTCRHGQIHCFNQLCSPLSCNKTVLKKGQCCPTCLEIHPSELCKVSRTVYNSGESWWSGNCTECVCLAGQTVCTPITCPLLTCAVMIRKHGDCCPLCINDSLVLSSTPSQGNTNFHITPRIYVHNPAEGSPKNEENSLHFIIVFVVMSFVILLLLSCLLYYICMKAYIAKRLETKAKQEKTTLPLFNNLSIDKTKDFGENCYKSEKNKNFP